MLFSFREFKSTVLLVVVGLGAISGCAKGQSTQLASSSAETYCPYLPSKTFTSPVNVSGTAVYEYRIAGNGAVSDGGVVVVIDAFLNSATRTYSVDINSRVYTVQSTGSGTASQVDVVTKLKAAINADTSAGISAYGIAQLTVTQPGSSTSPTVTAVQRVTVGTTNAAPRPIRFAEIAVKDSSGAIVQCAETLVDGTFNFELPINSGTYSIEVRSRANNSRNTAFVLNNPTAKTHYKISTSSGSASSTTGIYLRARVVDGLLGGAFNILDQILNAQDYLRNETGSCDQSGHASFFAGCVPFVTAPIVNIFWTPGFSPAVYVGATGSISYYLNQKRELYLQGGQSGNITSSDMDHFDNSVILHEYAHFLEDVFGAPNSPGGSHNGDSIIDPRLAWGEGWANFFQAAVTGDPVYRDTYGTPDCTSACAGTYFNHSLDPVGTPPNDAPLVGALGEGNFREFSISRMLWDVVKPGSGVSRFSEIWRAFVTAADGMKSVNDPFKTVGRFHYIQSQLTNLSSWSSIRLNEEQMAGFWFYATPFSLSSSTCANSPTTINPYRPPWDNGSFATSDQYRSNDFYRFEHHGGNVIAQLFYDKPSSDTPDLDLYIYRSGYIYGKQSDILLESSHLGDGCPTSGNQGDSSNPFRGANTCTYPPAGLSSSFGHERASATLPAGTYMINVKADTSVRAGSQSKYVILLNGYRLCPLL